MFFQSTPTSLAVMSWIPPRLSNPVTCRITIPNIWNLVQPGIPYICPMSPAHLCPHRLMGITAVVGDRNRLLFLITPLERVPFSQPERSIDPQPDQDRQPQSLAPPRAVPMSCLCNPSRSWILTSFLNPRPHWTTIILNPLLIFQSQSYLMAIVALIV